MTGLIHIYTGDGKGKTTAAVGLAVRCAGSGANVVFCQFLKNNQSSELNILRMIPQITLVQTAPTLGFYKSMTAEQRTESKHICIGLLEKAITAALTNNARLLVLDEVVAAYNHQMLDRERLLAFLREKPTELEIVLTGRKPAPELIELADYLSEVTKLKHPFDRGIPARRGIEK